MKPERWQELDKLFHLALEREPGERAAFLDAACAGDELLHRQVEALLAAHEEPVSFCPLMSLSKVAGTIWLPSRFTLECVEVSC